MASLRLAFTIIHFLDPDCTEYHQGGEENSTYHVAITEPGAYDDSQPNVTTFFAECTATNGVYKTYVGVAGSDLPDYEVPGDTDIIKGISASINLEADTECLLANNTDYWQPDDEFGDPVTDAFYIKSVIPDPVGSYTGRCVVTSAPVAPTKGPTAGPTFRHGTTSTDTTKYRATTNNGYALFIVMCVVMGGIGGTLLTLTAYMLFTGARPT